MTTDFDISDTLAPTSDQLDAIELVAGPRTFTVESVAAGNPEQPVQIKLAEFPRVWRPSKGMRRVLAAAWGVHASAWTGRRVTLYFDPDVTFGKDRTGGTRISHMSDLPKGRPLSIPLLVTRGKSAMFTVQPLPDAPPVTAGITDRQIEQLAAAFRAANITDRDAGLAYLSQTAGREVASSKELTEPEASAVLKALAADAHPAPPQQEVPEKDEPADTGPAEPPLDGAEWPEVKTGGAR